MVNRRVLIQRIVETRKEMLELIERLNAERLVTPAKEGDRAPKEMFQHMADADRRNLEWLRKLRDEDSPELTQPAPQQRATPAIERSMEELLDEMRQVREEVMAFLAEVSDQEWDRKGHNAMFGDVTLAQVAWLFHRHDQQHIDELLEREQTYPQGSPLSLKAPF